jgi:hypothetical protein
MRAPDDTKTKFFKVSTLVQLLYKSHYTEYFGKLVLWPPSERELFHGG